MQPRGEKQLLQAEVNPNTPKSKPGWEATAGKGEQLNYRTVKELLCSLEDLEDATENSIATLGCIVQKGKEAQRRAMQRLRKYSLTMGQCWKSPYHQSNHLQQMNGSKACHRKETMVCQIRRKRLTASRSLCRVCLSAC